MNKKIILIVVAALVIAAVIAASAFFLFKDKIVSNRASSVISSYFDNSESVRSWNMESAEIENNDLIIKGLVVNLKSGMDTYFEEIIASNIDLETNRAEIVTLKNTSVADQSLLAMCDNEEAIFSNVDLSLVEELLAQGNDFSTGYPIGFDSARIANLTCNFNNAVFTADEILVDGPFEPGRIPQYSSFEAKDLHISSMEGMISFEVPRIAGHSRYDENSGRYTFSYEPIELVNYFIMELDIEMADFIPNQFTDYGYDPLENLKFSHIRFKLTDTGMADRFFSSIGIFFGTNDVIEVKRNIVAELRNNTAAFITSFENGVAIQNAVVDYISDPVSIELVMNPPEPVTLNFSDEIIPYIADYNMTMSINGRAPIEVR